MKRVFYAAWLLLAFQSHASFTIYGVGNLGMFRHQAGQEKFFSLDKIGGGLGFEFEPLPFLSLAAELDYTTGSAGDPIPSQLKGKVASSSYNGITVKGVDFVPVQYFELWLRPKLMIPIPIVQPYLVVPFSPFSYGGIKGYSTFGWGISTLAGVQVQLACIKIFVEAGATWRIRKGEEPAKNTPPWGMNDLSFPISAGVGFSF